MKNKLLTLLFTFPLTAYCFAQSGDSKKISSDEKGISVSLGVNAPVGNFSSTHFLGIGIDCSPSSHWFGLLKRKKIAFTYTGGVAYYFGKKESVSSYPYKYPGFTFIHAFAGAFSIPFNKTSVKLTAGPALGIYNGNIQFNIGSRLEASYYINNKFFLGPDIILMKEYRANALWSLAIRAGIML
ncbi:MAG: hypothetical protein V9F01_00430 [Chitinophagaceae bacterium]